MKIGTKSILFGAHQFILHPALMFVAWWKLFGFPWDPRLWVAFVVHDLGYWGKPNMDGPEGEDHALWGADLMGRMFGEEWRKFTLFHSRFMAQRHGAEVSKLCLADKMVIVLHPKWLYMIQTTLSGEIFEFMHKNHHENGKYKADNIDTSSKSAFVDSMKAYMRVWIKKHLS